MDLNAITQMIGAVGFPIFCCIYMVQTNSKTIKELKESVDNNTVIMQKILTKLDMDKEQ